MTIKKMMELIKEAPGLDGVDVQYKISDRRLQLAVPLKEAGPEGMITSEVLESVQQVLELFNLKTRRWGGFDKEDNQYFMLYLEGEMDDVFLPMLRIVESYRNTYAPGFDLKYLNDGVVYNMAIFGLTAEAAKDLDEHSHELCKQLEPFGKRVADITYENTDEADTWFWSITIQV